MLYFLLAVCSAPVAAQMFGFDQIFRQAHEAQRQQQAEHQQRQRQNGMNIVEASYYEVDCPKYLCEDTLSCVDSPVDCPCAFESEIKCVLPDKKTYICISAPSNEDSPTCDTVIDAWNGKI